MAFFDDGDTQYPGEPPPGPPVGTPNDPVYGGNVMNTDPWGQHPGDRDYGYPPGTNPTWDHQNTGTTTTPPPGGGGGGGGGTGGGGTPIPNPSDYPAPAVPTLRPPPDPLKPWEGTFTAPTAEEAASTPGFQFQLGQAMSAIQRSAAAKGTLLTGGTLKGMEGTAVDMANTNYGDVYNRAADTYDKGRTNFLTNEANRYNSQYQDWAGQFGQEANLFGMNDMNRMHSWGMGSDYFNMGQSQRMNDFNIWDVGNPNSVSNLMRWAQITRPPSPYPMY